MHNMIQASLERKTCFTNQIRQSSTARAASGQAGMTSAAVPGIDTTKRPRLKEIASSRGSFAAKSAVTRMPFASNWAGKFRVAELVHTNMLDAGAALVCEIITRRVALVH